MRAIAEGGITYKGKPFDTHSGALGELRVSTDIQDDPRALRMRFAEDGYLFLPGILHRPDVLAARDEILRRLDAAGFIDRRYSLSEAIPVPDCPDGFVPQLARDNPELERVIFQGPMMDFYARFLGGPVRHFDFIWLRAKRPGPTDPTPPHYDVVFMGRGTRQLYTSWTPLEDVPVEKGGLMILEGSHRLEHVKSTYGEMDVDTYCMNKPEASVIQSGEKQWEDRVDGGRYCDDAPGLLQRLGGRWLTADYRAGDLLLFGMYLMHASGDNGSRGFRLSTDTRYQLASEPVDERWIGRDPVAHGPGGKRGLIC